MQAIREKWEGSMNNKYIGIALIVIGIALIVWGYNIYDSAESHISRAFNGEVPAKAWLGMIGGAICAIVGVLKVK